MTFEGGGSEGEALVHIQVNYLPKRPVQAHANGGVIFIPKMFLSVGLRVSQSRLQFDRAENYTFVLALKIVCAGLLRLRPAGRATILLS
jgi:hypothetical protein